VGELNALLERWQRVAVAAGLEADETRGSGRNHPRRITALGHLAAALMQSPTTAAQVRGMHALAKGVEATLRAHSAAF
jgi:hypothetical protein